MDILVSHSQAGSASIDRLDQYGSRWEIFFYGQHGTGHGDATAGDGGVFGNASGGSTGADEPQAQVFRAGVRVHQRFAMLQWVVRWALLLDNKIVVVHGGGCSGWLLIESGEGGCDHHS